MSHGYFTLSTNFKMPFNNSSTLMNCVSQYSKLKAVKFRVCQSVHNHTFK